jgi:hypothetical protein
MLGVVRLYAFRSGISNVFDCLPEEAKDLRRRLLSEGWSIYHTVAV